MRSGVDPKIELENTGNMMENDGRKFLVATKQLNTTLSRAVGPSVRCSGITAFSIFSGY